MKSRREDTRNPPRGGKFYNGSRSGVLQDVVLKGRPCTEDDLNRGARPRTRIRDLTAEQLHLLNRPSVGGNPLVRSFWTLTAWYIFNLISMLG